MLVIYANTWIYMRCGYELWMKHKSGTQILDLLGKPGVGPCCNPSTDSPKQVQGRIHSLLGFSLQVDDDATLTIGPQDRSGQPILKATRLAHPN